MMRTGKSHAGRVNLTKYVKVRGAASETWRFCPVVPTSNGRIRPDYVLIDAGPNSTEKVLTTSSGIAMEDGIENRWARVQAKRLLLPSAKFKFSGTRRSGSRSSANRNESE
jgi:hypothetical protein